MTADFNLKPLSIGQLLDRAIRLYRQNFLLFIGIITLSQIPATIFVILLTLFTTTNLTDISSFDPSIGIVAGIVGGVTAIISILATQVGTAALTRAVADNYMGQKIGIWEAYLKIGRSWLSLLGALLLCFVAFIILLLLFVFIPCIGWASAIPGFGFLMFFSMVVIPLIAPIIVLEGKGARSAISRGWDLARRRFWWVFGFVIILTIFAQLIVTGPTALVQFALLSAMDSMDPVVRTVLQQLVSFLLSIIFLPMQLTCITLLYFDIRVRTEGFDLALLTANVEETAFDMSTLASEAPTTRANWTPSGTELGYFSLITIGFAVIIGGFVGILSLLGLAFGSAFGGL